LNEVAGVCDGRGGLWVFDGDFSMVWGSRCGKGLRKQKRWRRSRGKVGAKWQVFAGYQRLMSGGKSG
jgi:hypothetical protein